MQVSIEWLHDYIDFKETAEELADKYTMAGVPVENVVRADSGLDRVVTGRIEKLEPNPDSDHLLVCRMNVGQKELVTIQTGADNVHEGDIVPVALVGAHLPNGLKIAKGKLRGIVSNGMLCSAGELKLDESKLTEEQKNGIYILPPDTPVGIPASKALGLDGVILEFELTANRGDCFSVLGLVREAAVLTGGEAKFPEIRVEEDASVRASDLIEIGIAAPELCSRFSARVLQNVKIAPSPAWMAKRLEDAGIRAINNVVDVTNFVMLELGQPMHAYDWAQIAGKKLTARLAAKGEELHTLDDSSRRAKGTELVIADAEKAAGLAGVMGGLESEVTDATQTVVLEAAAFNGASIRRTSRALGLRSEASGRFERGVDVAHTVRALDRAAQLLQQMGACTVASGVVDVYPTPKAPVEVTFTAAAVNARLGTEIEGAEMKRILEKLGFAVREESSSYIACVPSWRSDVTLMEDISEEVARIHGYDKIAATRPRGEAVQGRQSERLAFIGRIKEILTGLGMTETVSFSFTHPSMFDKMQVPQASALRRAVPIMNPLTDEYPLVRTTLLSSLLENAQRNFSRKNEDLRLFEVAPIFVPKELPVTEQPEEIMKLAGLLAGRRHPIGWNQDNEAVDFYDVKGVVEELLARLSIAKYTVESGEHFALHPGKTAFFKKGREVIAVLGEVHPTVLKALGIHKKAYIFEMDVETLLKYRAKNFRYEPLPRFPAISRDLALLVDEQTDAAQLARTIEKSAGKFFKDLHLFDVYTGEQVAEGKKSMAFSVDFQSADKTLKDEEADEAVAKILAALQKECGTELRA